ncbi:MAG: molybdopterin molybdotransferase MoeA [Desulfosoma sp.]
MISQPQAIPLEEAVRLAAQIVQPASLEWVPLPEALHRILAQDIIAPFSIPSESRSRMDGYAVRAADTQGATLKHPRLVHCLEHVLSAGSVPAVKLEPGTACRILTGAVLPAGADAVVPDENTERIDGQLKIYSEVLPGQWVTSAGEWLERGTVTLRAGHRLTPSRISAAAALGCSLLPLVVSCRVALASTGDEILELGTKHERGGSYPDTRYLLAAMLQNAGAVPMHLGCIPDNPFHISAVLEAAAGDIVITTGGTGGGNKDLIFQVWNDLGIVPVFRGVEIKPGSSTALGTRKNQLYWALPGSPWAAQVIFHELFLPVLERWYGTREPLAQTFSARLKCSMEPKGRGARAIPGNLVCCDGTLWFDPLLQESPSSLIPLAEKNAYALVPAQAGLLPAETFVTVRLLLGSSLDSSHRGKSPPDTEKRPMSSP